VGVLEANQFSTTTKLKGVAVMTLGAGSNAFVSGVTYPTGTSTNAITLNYDVKLNLDTSFTGKDLLRTTLRGNNYQNSTFGAAGTLALADASNPSNVSGDAVAINRLFYQFPIGEAWTATFGAKVRQDDMLAMWPSAYNADTILDRMTYAGAPGAYNLNMGAGAGLSYKKNGFNLSVNYVSNQLAAGNSANVSNTSATTDASGIGAASTTTAQVGYAADNWGMAFVYSYSNAAALVATLDANASYSVNGANALGFSAYWQPKTTGLIPSISAGVGTVYYNGNVNGGSNTSWQVALQWNDAFIKGNALGMAYGDTAVGGTAASGSPTYAYELFYKFQVTDNISVTPAFFWVDASGTNNAAVGGIMKTTFKF
jgi:hypothetical protein